MAENAKKDKKIIDMENKKETKNETTEVSKSKAKREERKKEVAKERRHKRTAKIAGIAVVAAIVIVIAAAAGKSICLAAFPVVGFQIISSALLQSIGQASKAIWVSLLRQVIFLIPLLFILPRISGLEGVWMSFPVSDVFATVATLGIVWYQLREIDIRARTRAHI